MQHNNITTDIRWLYKLKRIPYFTEYVLIIMTVLVIIIGKFNPRYSENIYIFFDKILYPIKHNLSHCITTVSHLKNYVMNYNTIIQDNIFLRDTNAELETTIFNMMKSEKKEILEQHHYLENYLSDIIELSPYNVISYNINDTMQTITVAIGDTDNIEEGAAVLSKGKIIGKVSHVGSKLAKILLITDPNCRFTALTTENNITLILKGLNSQEYSHMEVLHINKSINNVSDGDYVFTRGDSITFPAGIYVGKIVKDMNNLVVEISSDITSLQHVYIIRRKY